MKKYLGFLLLLMVVNAKAQQTNATAGVDATGTTGSASITIGQQDYINYSNASGYSNEGVQHPYELFGGAVNTWTGASSTDWNDARNWSGGNVPTSITNVTIPANLSTQPVLSGDIVVGDISLIGSLSLNGHTLTINGAVTGSGYFKGSNTSSLVINGTAGTISFDPAANNLNNLTITGSASLGNTLNIYGIFAPTSGSFNTNNFLHLKSTSIASSAVVDKVGGALTGTVTVERFVPQNLRVFRDLSVGVANAGSVFNNWQEGGNNGNGYGILITGSKGTSAGVDAATGLDITGSGNHSMYTFTNNVWDSVLSTKNTNLDPYQGYRVLVRGDRTVDMFQRPQPAAMLSPATIRATGQLVTGTVTYTTSEVTGSYNSGYHLSSGANAVSFITNPYICPIDWTTIWNSGTNLTASYWYADPTFLSVGYTPYISYNAVSQTSSNPQGSKINQFIQPGQAFFVQNSTSGSPQLVINESDKAPVSTKTAIFGNAPASRISVGLYKAGTNIDGTVAVFNSNFSKSIGNEDSYKFSNTLENIAIKEGTNLLSIDGLPLPKATEGIPIQLYQLQKDSVYTIRVDVSALVSNGITAYLKDAYLNKQTTLAGDRNRVSFTATGDTNTYNNRFSILFGATSLPVNTVRLTASPQKNSISVQWTAATGNPINYTLERSANGSNFTPLQTVAAGTVAAYNYLDAKANAGINYYRILTNYQSGAALYSQVATAALASNLSPLTVYPNPAKGMFKVQLSNAVKGSYTIELVNKTGKKVLTKKVNTNGGWVSEPITLTHRLAAGNYAVRMVASDGTTFTTQIDIQ